MDLSKREKFVTIRKCQSCQQLAVLDGCRFCSVCGKKQNLYFEVEPLRSHLTSTSSSGEAWSHFPLGRGSVSYVSIKNYDEVINKIETDTLNDIGTDFTNGHKEYFRKDEANCLLIHHLSNEDIPLKSSIEVVVSPFDMSKKGFNLVYVKDKSVDEITAEMENVDIKKVKKETKY